MPSASRKALHGTTQFKVRSVPLALAVASAMALGLALALSGAHVAGSGWYPIAVPSSVSAAEVRARLKAAGFEGALGADTAMVALSDFSALRMVTVAEASARVKEGDPRSTPFLEALEEAFAIGPDWRLYYFPHSIGRGSGRLASIFKGIGLLTPGPKPAAGGNAGPGYMWLVPVALGVAFILGKPRIDLIYKILLSATWLPLLASPGTAAVLAALIVETATHASYYLFPPVRRAHGASRPGILSLERGPLVLAVFSSGALLLCVLSPPIAPALGAAAVLSALAVLKRKGIVKGGRKRLAHELPAFVPITGLPGLAKTLRRVAVTALASLMVLSAALIVPTSPANAAAAAGESALERYRIELGGSGDPLGDHIAFQLALTYGRLGEAVWGGRTYTPSVSAPERAIPVERKPDDPIIRAARGNIATLVDGSGIIAWRRSDSGGMNREAGSRLDIMGFFSYILAMAPVWGAILLGMYLGRGRLTREGMDSVYEQRAQL